MAAQPNFPEVSMPNILTQNVTKSSFNALNAKNNALREIEKLIIA
jgi:hypothetical protein